jgi:hypothetical protein
LFKPPSGSIDTFSIKLLNDLEWFARYGGFIVRDSCDDENCAVDLAVDDTMVQRIRGNLESLSKTAVHDHFVTPRGSTKEMPPFPREGSYQTAKSISKALLKTAVWDRDLVRTAASVYAYGVRASDNLLAAPQQ